MFDVPTRYALVSASAEGRTPLTAFDRALLLAGVGNLNLVKVSSIVPPGAAREERVSLPEGALLPIAYASLASDAPGAVISAAVGVGRAGRGFGMIMEYSGQVPEDVARERVESMVREAFANRGLEVAALEVASSTHTVERVGCVFAGVPLWR